MGEGNGAAMEYGAARRKQTLISVLCKYFSINPDALPNDHLEWPDIKSIVINLVQLLGKENILGVSSNDREELYKWLEFADSFHSGITSTLSKLKTLDETLVQRSVLMGKGLQPSVADVVLLASLHDVVNDLSDADRSSVTNVMRWIDYIQNKEDFSSVFEKIKVEKLEFKPHGFQERPFQPGEAGVTSKNAGSRLNECNGARKEGREVKTSVKDASTKTVDTNVDRNRNEGEKDKKEKDKKVKKEEMEPTEKEIEVSVASLDIKVGVVCKAWKHPSADSLLVEEIDVGEEKVRQVVSGLAKYYTADELLNRQVLVVTNVKPGKLRDVMSSGLVLCASNQDHNVVEPLLPPKEAKIGERITFVGHEGKPEEVLNPKKKQLEKITPYLYTDDKGVATFKGVPFMTSAGACKSSIANASIK